MEKTFVLLTFRFCSTKVTTHPKAIKSVVVQHVADFVTAQTVPVKLQIKAEKCEFARVNDHF